MQFPICIDFDGTIVEHEYPKIGYPVPGAIEWMHAFQAGGARLILYTMRSYEEFMPIELLDEPTKPLSVLQAAIDYCTEHGIGFWGINENPEQRQWSESRKVYAKVYIDDANAGSPLVVAPDQRPYVDWGVIGPTVMRQVETFNREK